jgi:hypothetical protein
MSVQPYYCRKPTVLWPLNVYPANNNMGLTGSYIIHYVILRIHSRQLSGEGLLAIRPTEFSRSTSYHILVHGSRLRAQTKLLQRPLYVLTNYSHWNSWLGHSPIVHMIRVAHQHSQQGPPESYWELTADRRWPLPVLHSPHPSTTEPVITRGGSADRPTMALTRWSKRTSALFPASSQHPPSTPAPA